MPDWRAMVEEQLAGLQLPAERRDEVCRELAAHLEDDFAVLCERLPEGEAERHVRKLLRATGLRRCIEAAEREGPMNQRTRSLWIPGLTALIASGFLLIAIGRFGPDAMRVVLLTGVPPLILYPLWLLSLPLFGALGACLAKRAGATKPQRLLAGLFPLMTMAAAFFIILPVAMLVDGIRIDANWAGNWLLLATLNWIVIPGVPLLLGALPFLRNGSTQTTANA